MTICLCTTQLLNRLVHLLTDHNFIFFLKKRTQWDNLMNFIGLALDRRWNRFVLRTQQWFLIFGVCLILSMLQCSRSCDGGVRVRHASCQDAAGREVHATMCNNQEKNDREKCNEQICAQWRFGKWGSCSVSCGDGIETRDAVCTDREGRELEQCQLFIYFLQ